MSDELQEICKEAAYFDVLLSDNLPGWRGKPQKLPVTTAVRTFMI
jgi:hypothetical protein